MRLIVAAVLLATVPLTAAALAKPRHHCNPPGAKSVARDEHGRVYYVQRNGYDYYYACLYSTGRTRPVGHNPHNYDYDIVRVDVASPYVAFTEILRSSQVETTMLSRLDLRSGRTIDLEPRGEVRRFFATGFGAVVWAQYRASVPTMEIKGFDRDGGATLDSGVDIPARSLHLSRSGRRAYWDNAGRTMSAPLH
jgi:hypothetical protein